MSTGIGKTCLRLKDLEKLAGNYANTTDEKKINKLVAPCLRYATERYYDWKWKAVLRSVDKDFVKYVEKKDSLVIDDLDIMAEDLDGNEVDFIHLIATVEGYEYPSTAGKAIPSSYFGWAGDLASQAPNLEKKLEARGVTANLENAKKYASLTGNASVTDMITDIDAALISKKL